jgi:DNA polymerase
MKVISCICCNLCKARKKIVNGRGNPFASIWIIGRDPGREEDIAGKPFVGRAGKYMEKLLDNLGLKLDTDFYTINLVRCHTPNNRGPNIQEINACQELLFEEISLYQPQVLILLGKVVSDSFLNIKQPISALRGQLFFQDYFAVMPTFHPSYLVRNTGKFDHLFQSDIMNAIEFLNGQNNNENEKNI